MGLQHGIVLDRNSNNMIDFNTYDLEVIETINPGPPSEGQNYNALRNKPQINSVTLEGNISLSQLGIKAIYYHTTQEWNSRSSLMSEEGILYVYSDHKTVIKDGRTILIPGLKIGDGSAYIIDLPFITDTEAEAITTIQQVLDTHMASTDAHTTLAEKDFWNNKVSANLNPDNPENLVLTKF